MRQRTTIAVAVLTCLTLFSCGSESEKKTKKDVTEQVDPILTSAKTLNGQPGVITLTGENLIALAGDAKMDPPKKISISVKAGADADGKDLKTNPQSVTFISKIDAAASEAVSAAEGTKLFINVGCDISKRTDLAGLEEKKVTVASLEGVVTLTAHTILLCGANPLKANLISLTAQTVILDSVEESLVGGVESMISIRAREIILKGKNLLSSLAQQREKVVQSADTLNPVQALPVGPSISLTAEKMSGEGTLSLTSKGESAAVPAAVVPESAKLTKDAPSALTGDRETQAALQAAVISESQK